MRCYCKFDEVEAALSFPQGPENVCVCVRGVVCVCVCARMRVCARGVVCVCVLYV